MRSLVAMWNRGALETVILAMGVLPGGEEGVEEHKELESYLWVRSVGAGVAGGGPAAGAGAWRRWWRRAAVLRRGWASGGGLGTFSVPRGTHSGARLERRWSEEGGVAVSFRRWPWRALLVLAQKEEKIRVERESCRCCFGGRKSEEGGAWLAGLFGFGAERSERRCRVGDGAQAVVGLR